MGSLIFLEKDATNLKEIRAREERQLGLSPVHLCTFGFHKLIYST